MQAQQRTVPERGHEASTSSEEPSWDMPAVVRGARLIERLSKLQPATGRPHKLTVGLPPSSLASIALTKQQVEAAENSDPLVENMLRALIHMDNTPRSDISSPLSPTVLALDLPAGRVESLPAHAAAAHRAWDEASEWGSGFAQVLRGPQSSPTTVVRRRLAAIRCAPASPKKRPSPYLRTPASGPARSQRAPALRFSQRSALSPARGGGGVGGRPRLSWAHGVEADLGSTLVLRRGRVMAV